MQFLSAVEKMYVTKARQEFAEDTDEVGKKLDSATTRFKNTEQVLINGTDCSSIDGQFQDQDDELSQELEVEKSRSQTSNTGISAGVNVPRDVRRRTETG